MFTDSALGFCLKNKFLVILLTLAALAAAVFSGREIPVDVFPELEVPRVTVQAEAAGMTAEEVERYVTIPIESAMNGATKVEKVRSSSGGGLSFVWVDFEWGTDIYLARQIVAERLSGVLSMMPAGVVPEMSPVVSVTGEIMLIALRYKKDAAEKSPEELRRTGEYALRNRLLAVPGVGQVTVIGGRLPEYQIIYDPARLHASNVALDDLKNAVVSAGTNVSAGYIEDAAGLELSVRQDSRVEEIEHIRRSRVATEAGKFLRVGDVADVRIGGAPRRGNAGFMGEEAVILSVQKVPGANTRRLTDAVEAAVADFSAGRLPETMTLSTHAYRQADFIDLSLENGMNILFTAAFVVVLVVFLSLLNFRTTLITLAAMPLSVLFAVGLFPCFGIAVNIMTLGGLAVAVGDVVDNAIIFVELAWRKLSQNAALPEGERRSRTAVLLDAKREIFSSITFSSAIILFVFAPVLFLSGLEGQFYKPLGIAYMLAFGMSLFVALTVVPVLCALFFKPSAKSRGNKEAGEPASVRLIQKIYAPVLAFSLNHAKALLAGTAALTVAALAFAGTFGVSFLPPFNEDCYTVFINTAPGTSLDETERISRGCAEDLEKIDGVLSVARRTGRAENDEHAEPVSASELLVRVDLSKNQREIRNAIQNVIGGIPGTTTMIGYPLAHRISAALSGSNSEIAVNIYGEDLARLRNAVAKAKKILDTLPEAADARANREVLTDCVRIDYKREVLGLFGLSVAEAAEQVSTAVYGQKLGEVIKNQDRWNIVLRGERNLSAGMDDIGELLLSGDGGQCVRLGDAADISLEQSPNLILHDRTLRKAMISCNASPDSNIGDLVVACKKHLDPEMYKLGCSVEYAGTIQARESAALRLYLLSAAIVVFITVLLTKGLGSLRSALTALSVIPLCLIGGVATVWIAAEGVPVLSVSSIVGFVTVVGFAVRSGIILLNRYRDLTDAGMSFAEALKTGSRERVVPILMTSLTTELGLLPLMFALDKPGGELLAPLAIVQFGGLISATALSLVIVPAAAKVFCKPRREIG